VNRSGWQRRLPALAGAFVFAAANLVFFVVYGSGADSRRAALEARRESLAKIVSDAEKEAGRLTGQKERLSGVSDAIAEFYGHRIGTQRETLAAVVDDLHAAMARAGVSTNAINYSTISDEKLPLVVMRISFSVRCDYQRFKKLLHEFEAGKRWIAVRNVGIGRDAEQPGSVNVQLDLVTYFAERGDEPRPPKPAAEARAAVGTGRSG
jgi:Type II secretion system (T2SS), protein M subtype b